MWESNQSHDHKRSDPRIPESKGRENLTYARANRVGVKNREFGRADNEDHSHQYWADVEEDYQPILGRYWRRFPPILSKNWRRFSPTLSRYWRRLSTDIEPILKTILVRCWANIYLILIDQELLKRTQRFWVLDIENLGIGFCELEVENTEYRFWELDIGNPGVGICELEVENTECRIRNTDSGNWTSRIPASDSEYQDSQHQILNIE